MEFVNRNLYNKQRIFGNDITNLSSVNLQRRSSNNYSICEKASQKQAVEQQRIKSKSVSNNTKSLVSPRDPISKYEKDIMRHMTGLQKLESPQLYRFIHEDMRFVLIDWLVEVHESFELREQTLQLAIVYLNEFSSRVEVTKHEYQLVGITCLWIASKYEEIYPPKMNNYVDVTDNSYTIRELKEMEGRIIQELGFNLTYTTTLNVLEAISDRWPKERNHKRDLVMTRDSLKVLAMCKYLLELAMVAGLNKRYDQTLLVMGAITIADSIFKLKSDVRALEEGQRPDKDSLMKCFKDMCDILKDCHKHKKYNAVIKKYQKDRFSKVAKIKISQK